LEGWRVKYFRPTSLAEALAIRRCGDVTLLAGATDIYPAYVGRKAWGDPVHKDVLDLSAVPGLRAIEIGEHEIRLGALVTWSDLVRSNLPTQFDGFRAAAHEVGGEQIQNRGTIVGNACTASPAGDGIPNLLALDAVFEIAGTSTRLERVVS
jgi:xanthine dehydrogenase small subunit